MGLGGLCVHIKFHLRHRLSVLNDMKEKLVPIIGNTVEPVQVYVNIIPYLNVFEAV